MLMIIRINIKLLHKVRNNMRTLYFLPSDNSTMPHFHQFGELTAERRFLFELDS